MSTFSVENAESIVDFVGRLAVALEVLEVQ